MFREISLHILDIAENCVQAGAKNVNINIAVSQIDDRLQIVIIDDGKGMEKSTMDHVMDPFITSRTTRNVGLGLPFLKEAAEACNGLLEIQSEINKGTTVRVEFQLSHIDRMPLGDIQSTFLNLLVGYPEVHWIFHYKYNHKEFHFDDDPIKEELVNIPLSAPTVLAYLRGSIESGLEEIKAS